MNEQEGNGRFMILVLAVLLTVCAINTANAEEENLPSEKSMGITIGLGLDPIPGDALLYSGKPIQAGLNFALGATGATLITLGFMQVDGGSLCSGDDCGLTYVAIGGGAFLASYLWDVFGGIHGTYTHNQRVRKRREQSRLLPILAPTKDGFMAGLRMEF